MKVSDAMRGYAQASRLNVILEVIFKKLRVPFFAVKRGDTANEGIVGRARPIYRI
jgi:hypothetical protein